MTRTPKISRSRLATIREAVEEHSRRLERIQSEFRLISEDLSGHEAAEIRDLSAELQKAAKALESAIAAP